MFWRYLSNNQYILNVDAIIFNIKTIKYINKIELQQWLATELHEEWGNQIVMQ